MLIESVGTPMTTSILQVLADTLAPHCSTTSVGAAGASQHWKTGTGPGGGVTTLPSPPLPPGLLHARIAPHATIAGPIRWRLTSRPPAGARKHAHEEVKIGQVDAGAGAAGLQIEVRGRQDIARVGAGPERLGEH